MIVGEFRNGQDAILFLEKNPVDLAVIDYYMPVMDGREFILNCRERQFPISIIMITAANHVQEISGILQLGIVDYLVKPFTFERFQIAIEKYLSMKKVLHSEAQLNELSAGESRDCESGRLLDWRTSIYQIQEKLRGSEN